MGSCITKCSDPPFVRLIHGRKEKVIRKSQFMKCRNMEQLIRLSGFFPIARIVSMKTSARGVFAWDSAMIYPDLEICVEDMYGMKKIYTLEMVALYRR